MEKSPRKIIEVINNFFKKHWFWYTIIITFPTIWFSVILPFLGGYLKLQNKNGITLLGGILSIIIVIPITLFTIVNNWYASKGSREQLENLQGEVSYLGLITENVDRICEEKYQKLKRTIVEVKDGRQMPPQIVTKPNDQLKRIITGITSCLTKCIESVDNRCAFKDLLVSIAYNFPLENDTWEWCEGMNERYLTLSELLAPDCSSTFRYLMTTRQPWYFNNLKEDAKKNRQYFYNKQDEMNAENKEPVGSIFCYNFQVKKGNVVYVNAYLSISTNKKRFSVGSEEECRNTKDNMIALVRDTFGKRICIELCLLYLEYLGNLPKD